ncbi:MAG TPA: type II toxin-antitoxin system HicA family toxin [Candidatus Acidoferrales bacterium]|jgi:predicted RNA binding protein YcfA (HicA-like mRNA interferase family)|nr:type II toxin-antitoxin system HicA family toxin [Candidatus Acidoferrales bacterium]
MPKLPRDVSGERAVRAFGRAGFVLHHQTGSHMILIHPGDPLKTLTVPNHKALRPGTLSKLIKDAGLSVEQFIELL